MGRVITREKNFIFGMQLFGGAFGACTDTTVLDPKQCVGMAGTPSPPPMPPPMLPGATTPKETTTKGLLVKPKGWRANHGVKK